MAIPAYNEIAETLAALPTWEERYGFIIDLGHALPDMPEPLKTDALLVPGCTSRVWMLARFEDKKLFLTLDSDALIVKGLLAVLYARFNGLEAESIKTAQLEHEFETLGLSAHLSPNRRNGFYAVAKRIVELATLQN